MYEEELDEDGVDYYAIRPNKSQIKRDIAELAAFADALAALSMAQLKQFELEPELHNAIAAVYGMAFTNARKRQMKYVCGLLRKTDIEPLQEKLARLQSKSAHAVREHHAAERWRDNLINGEESVLTQFLNDYPASDRQSLRQLVRNAKRELTSATPQKSALLLYRALKEVMVNVTE